MPDSTVETIPFPIRQFPEKCVHRECACARTRLTNQQLSVYSLNLHARYFRDVAIGLCRHRQARPSRHEWSSSGAKRAYGSHRTRMHRMEHVCIAASTQWTLDPLITTEFGGKVKPSACVKTPSTATNGRPRQ